jgi:heat shock protein HslJ
MAGARTLLLAMACLVTLQAGAGCRAATERTPPPVGSATDGWRPIALTALAGRTWMLREWDPGDPAPAEPRITLRYDEGRFSGRSGCNRYNAAVMPGATPGAINVGTVAATRMMCPEPAIGIEGRFLAALPRARTIRLRDGRLGVTYEGPSGVATLVFDEVRAVAN